MKGIVYVAALLGSLVFTGCVTMPTEKEIAQFDYGQPVTIDYQAEAKKYFEDTLLDPDSAKYFFKGAPAKFWYKEAPFAGGRLFTGYLVRVDVNAKNRMGGYTGKQAYGIIFKNNAIVRVLSPSELSLMSSAADVAPLD